MGDSDTRPRNTDVGRYSVQRPIRVAQVVGKMNGGGVEAVVMNYYRHIDRSKVQFDFLVDEDSTRVPEEEIIALGGRVFRIPPYQHPIRYRRELIRLMREQQWPIVHSNINNVERVPAIGGEEDWSACSYCAFSFDYGQRRVREECDETCVASVRQCVSNGSFCLQPLCRKMVIWQKCGFYCDSQCYRIG